MRGSGRRTLLVIAIAAAVTAAAIGADVLLEDAEVVPGGPLVASDAAHGSGLLADAGDPLTYGGIAVYNSAAEPAVLERVDALRPSEGMRVVGTLAGPVPWGAFALVFEDFPPAEDSHPAWMVSPPRLLPLEGFVVPPQPRAGLDTARLTKVYVGLQSTKARGSVALESFAVHYRVGDRRYVLVVPQTVTICTPKDGWGEENLCPTFLPGDENPSRSSSR
ncbi:MAG TPA: hypothetical protein VK915_00900 [Gaiellaceae bacterium]|nr:hypothetical protein [Gaiellaceae bacterium]